MKADQIELFESWYRDYFPRIYRYAFRFVGNFQEAEQLTQETFVSLYDYVSSNSRVFHLKALIYRIAANACLNYVKREKKWEDIKRFQIPAEASSRTGEEEGRRKERRLTALRRALSRLSSRDQECLLLYQEGFSYAEIAEAVHLKKTSVGKILARATERLAREIKNGERSWDI